MIPIRISFCIPMTIPSLIFHGTGCPPAPMNHVKIFKGWPPPEMPLRNWYNCGTKHFNKTSVVCLK